jgi:ATP synthase protein I
MGDGDGKSKATSRREDAELHRKLDDLGRRIEASRAATGSHKDDVSTDGGPAKAGFAMATRMAADFVAGVLVGAALGWGIDRLFGTWPWGLAVFLLLGFAAGVLNLLRTVGAVRTGTPGDPKSPAADLDEDEED